jgi:hypothetical protein
MAMRHRDQIRDWQSTRPRGNPEATKWQVAEEKAASSNSHSDPLQRGKIIVPGSSFIEKSTEIAVISLSPIVRASAMKCFQSDLERFESTNSSNESDAIR